MTGGPHGQEALPCMAGQAEDSFSARREIVQKIIPSLLILSPNIAKIENVTVVTNFH